MSLTVLESKVPGRVLLSGIVGSTAYGLAGPNSDQDRLAVFAAPTRKILGLDSVNESIVVHEPSDYTAHEVGKYVKLALACNPTITELMWIDPSLYETVTPLGEELIGLRRAFLSAEGVRNAYLGYAHSQFKRLSNRDGESFSSDTKNRTRKHARHMARLLFQGRELYTTGELTVRVDNPEWFMEFSEKSPEFWSEWFLEQEAMFDELETCLPETPNNDLVNDWLLSVREENWHKTD